MSQVLTPCKAWDTSSPQQAGSSKPQAICRKQDYFEMGLEPISAR